MSSFLAGITKPHHTFATFSKCNTRGKAHACIQYGYFAKIREGIDTVLEPGIVVSMEPMLWVRESEPGAGGYREHDIFVLINKGAEIITRIATGPAFNIIPMGGSP